MKDESVKIDSSFFYCNCKYLKYIYIFASEKSKKRIYMKKSLFCFALVLFSLSSFAQEKGKIRVGLSPGLSITNSSVGFGGDIDFRYNIMDNLNVGLKYGAALQVKDLVIDELTPKASLTACGISSFLATSDYYFNKGTSMFAPFLGGGVGVYNVLNIGVTANSSIAPSIPTNLSVFQPVTRFGGLLRGGFESGHFRMGLEYYIVPKTNVVDLVTSTPMGRTNNSYLNFFLGFYFGGGHWKKVAE